MSLLKELWARLTCPPISKLILEYIDHERRKLAPGTLRNHEVKYRNLIDYERSRKKRFYPSTLTLPEAERFKRWFMDRSGTTNVCTASRNVQLFIAAMNFAAKQGRIKSHALIHYQADKDPVKEPISLTSDELLKIIKQPFLLPAMRKGRDLLLFQSLTGISHADLERWERKRISIGEVLAGRRAKNKSPYMVPLDAAAAEILAKYDGVLPKYSLQALNRILKEIAATCGIDKRITTHTGRKTFATMKKEAGWPIAAISSMLGHRSVTTTERHYLSTTFVHVEREMGLRRDRKEDIAETILKKVLEDRGTKYRMKNSGLPRHLRSMNINANSKASPTAM